METDEPTEKPLDREIHYAIKLNGLYRDRKFRDYLDNTRLITQGVRDLMPEQPDE